MMARYSISDYAKRVGLSRPYFYKLIKQEKIDCFFNRGKKEIESDLVDPIIKFKPAGRETADTYKKNGGKRNEKLLGPEASIGKKIKFNKDSDRATLEKALIYERAKKLSIENAKMDNSLVKVDEVANTVFSVLRPLRDDIQAISKRVSDLVHTAESKHEVDTIIKKETDRILLSRIGGEYIFDEELKKKIVAMLMS